MTETKIETCRFLTAATITEALASHSRLVSSRSRRSLRSTSETNKRVKENQVELN